MGGSLERPLAHQLAEGKVEAGSVTSGTVPTVARPIALVRALTAAWQSQITECYSDPSSDYDAIWYSKLAVIPVNNGDYIAIDLGDDHYGEVVYLSHDDGGGHGYVLGADFADFLRRWTPLGCPVPRALAVAAFYRRQNIDV